MLNKMFDAGAPASWRKPIKNAAENDMAPRNAKGV
jgi:hypothetical protein